MTAYILKTKRALFIVLFASLTSFSLESCSSVNVNAKQSSKADDTYSKTVVALWWGGSDPVESVDCAGNGLNIVSVKTNWFYSVCSFVTLGAVVPMDIEYRCTSGELQGGGDIGIIREVENE